jgi:hypothetical protein
MPSYATLIALITFMRNYTLVIAIVLLLIQLSSKKKLNSSSISFILLVPVIIAFCQFPINYDWYGMDYIVYAGTFAQTDSLSLEGHDAFLGVIMYLVKLFSSDVHVFFAVTSTLYIGIYVCACKRLTDGTATLSLFVLCFGGPFFIGYMDNTLRAGLALSLTLLAYSYMKESRVKAAIIAFFAVNIHYSTLLPIIAFAVSYYYPKPKLFIWVWVLSIFASLAAGSYFQGLFSDMVDDNRMSSYLAQNSQNVLGGYKVGFRWDFVIYSLIPLVVGWYYISKKLYNDHLYITIYSAYILANAFWILVIRAPFSDRFAYLSWFLLPIILVYPLLKNNMHINNPQGLYCAFLALIILFKIYI